MSINANSLPNQSTMAATDRLLGFASETNAGFSIDYTVLAKKIIEEYTGSTVAGSAQTLQTALDTLNSKLGGIELIDRQTVNSGETASIDLKIASTTATHLYLVFISASVTSDASVTGLYLVKQYIHATNGSHRETVTPVVASSAATLSIDDVVTSPKESRQSTLNVLASTNYLNTTVYKVY